MAEPLHALTALGHAAPKTVTIGAVSIIERFDVALASLAIRKGREAEVRALAAKAGLPLPEPARFAAGPSFSAFWVAPDMWFVEADQSAHEDIAGALKPLFGDAASITEQTDAWVRFDLGAEDLQGLLERLSNVDFARAADGFASRTVIEHIGCYLIRHGAGSVTLYGPRSSAASLLHALEVTAHSIA